MAFVSRRREAADEIRQALGPVAERMAAAGEEEITSLMRRSDPGGEEYPHPEGGTYQASAPGEPPAVRTGDYLASYDHTDWHLSGSRALAAVTSDEKAGDGGPLWAQLEYGTTVVAPRPHVRPSAEALAATVRRAARDTDRGAPLGGEVTGEFLALPPAA